jgi:DNA-binding winged helix-turn-helix (wHTH) protein/Tol biopolymer transport system component
MNGQAQHIYTFGPFLLDARQHILLRDGEPVTLAPKAVDILLPLVRNAGSLVGKDDLMKEVWPDAFVEEGNLSKNISVLRQALGNAEGGREYIETVPKRGYRFVATVRAGLADGERPYVEMEAQSVAIPAIGGDLLPATAPTPASQVGVGARNWPWGLAIFLTAAILAVAGGWVWLSRSPQLSVLKITQITHFGRVDPPSRLVTDGTRIFFVERQGGRHTLAVVPLEGGEPVQFPTPFPNTALYGISPDHSVLLAGSYTSDEDDVPLWLVPTTGGSPRRLGNVTGHDAAWSRDGQIAYFSGSGLYVVRPDGSSGRKLATIEGNGWFSRWAPDGRALRFSAWEPELRTLALWEVNAQGSNLHRMLAGWREHPTSFGDGESDGDWTPDGNYFVFRSTRAGLASIWALSEKGKFLRRPSRTPVQLTTTDSSLWSVLVVKNKIFYAGDKEVRELARYDTRSKQFVPFLPGVRARDVDFSKDGQWVAYVVPNMQDNVLWRSRVDGRDRQQLTFPPMSAGQPRWSPDGKQIVFLGNVPGKPGAIFLVASGGGEPEPLTTFYSLYPDWSPGADSVFFTAPVPASASHPTVSSTIGPNLEGTYQLDLKTRRVSIFPGAEALKALSWSPNGRYQVAQTRDNRELVLFDSQSQRWSELFRAGVVRAGLWSHDSKYVYTQDLSGGVSQPIFRVRISDRKTERIATFQEILRSDVRNYFLAGLAPDDSPVVSLILSHSDIYALDLNLP